MKFTEITLTDGRKIDGEETGRILMDECTRSGHVWMGIDSLNGKMSAARVKRMLRGVREGQKVHFYICVNNGHYQNEIAFSALIADIITYDEKTECPDAAGRPHEFAHGKSRNWVKLTAMKEEHEKKAEDLMVISTGSDLKWLLENSRMSFAYVTERYGY